MSIYRKFYVLYLLQENHPEVKELSYLTNTTYPLQARPCPTNGMDGLTKCKVPIYTFSSSLSLALESSTLIAATLETLILNVYLSSLQLIFINFFGDQLL